jgi:hypothetical protein
MRADELRRLHEAATEGPWLIDTRDPDTLRYEESPGNHPIVCETREFENPAHPGDARLIAALRNAAPRLIALLEAAERLGAARAAYEATGAHTCVPDDDVPCEVCERFAASRIAASALAAMADELHNDPQRGGGG